MEKSDVIHLKDEESIHVSYWTPQKKPNDSNLWKNILHSPNRFCKLVFPYNPCRVHLPIFDGFLWVYVGKYTHTWMVWFFASCDGSTPTPEAEAAFQKGGGGAVFSTEEPPPVVRCLAGSGFGFIFFWQRFTVLMLQKSPKTTS